MGKMCTIKISVLMLFYLLVSEIAGEERHNFSDCQSEPGDRLLTEKSIIRPYKFLGYTSSDMTYSNPDARINCIQVTDQKENGTGGYASIVSGGVGHNNVTLHFESQFSRGFSFVVKIYGQ
uniref:Venom protein R-like protein n=1 Tax=Coptotermes formosanus TaxID=36987 RepID=R4UK39_COPFO|nr:venom protein R-like protein [Coptotermes formosanus]